MSTIDPNYFDKSHEKLDIRIWELENQVRLFNEDWKEMQLYWQDSASDYISDRFISPIKSQDYQLTKAIKAQSTSSDHARQRFSSIQEKLKKAYQHQVLADEMGSSAEKDLQSAEFMAFRASDEMKQSQNDTKAASSLISSSDSYIAPM